MENISQPFDLVLLKVNNTNQPIYFVIKDDVHNHRDPDGDKYFYDEHTCPTNWTNDIIAVVVGNDEDPHGFATFVRRIQAPPDMTEDGIYKRGAHTDIVMWSDLFPELDEEPR